MPENGTSLYRLNLNQMKLTYELIGLPFSTMRQRDISEVPMAEPSQCVSIEAVAYQHTFPPLRYKGKRLSLTGRQVTISSSDEKYPETVLDVLDVAYSRQAEFAIALPDAIFAQFIELLRGSKMPEADMLCDVFFDNEDEPVKVHIRFRKIWLKLLPPVLTPRLTMPHIILAIVIGMMLFGWTQITDTTIIVSIIIIALLMLLFWPPAYIAFFKQWRGERRWWREVRMRHKKWREADCDLTTVATSSSEAQDER